MFFSLFLYMNPPCCWCLCRPAEGPRWTNQNHCRGLCGSRQLLSVSSLMKPFKRCWKHLVWVWIPGRSLVLLLLLSICCPSVVEQHSACCCSSVAEDAAAQFWTIPALKLNTVSSPNPSWQHFVSIKAHSSCLSLSMLLPPSGRGRAV